MKSFRLVLMAMVLALPFALDRRLTPRSKSALASVRRSLTLRMPTAPRIAIGAITLIIRMRAHLMATTDRTGCRRARLSARGRGTTAAGATAAGPVTTRRLWLSRWIRRGRTVRLRCGRMASRRPHEGGYGGTQATAAMVAADTAAATVMVVAALAAATAAVDSRWRWWWLPWRWWWRIPRRRWRSPVSFPWPEQKPVCFGRRAFCFCQGPV